jgi:SAM-dependent methyltransferase
MEAEHYAALDQNDRAYWWFAVRYTVVRRLLRRRIPDGLDAGPGSFLLDVGCGTGGFLADILESGFLGQGQVLGIEPPSAVRSKPSRRIVSLAHRTRSLFWTCWSICRNPSQCCVNCMRLRRREGA